MDTMDEKMTLVAAGPSYTAWSEFSDTRREFGDAGVPGARRFRPAQRRLRGEAMTRLKKAAMDGCTAAWRSEADRDMVEIKMAHVSAALSWD